LVLRVTILAVLACPLLAAPANASQLLALNADGASLRVNARGEALVTFEQAGARRGILARGGLNANQVDSGGPQVEFELDYRAARRAMSFGDRCRAYAGPPLPYLVAACTSPDGSHWAIQRWQRLLPLRGVEPFSPHQGAYELQLSHWTGPIPELQVSPNWTYSGRWQGLFGRLTYVGVPVFGSRTPSMRVSDGYARYVYIDTFNSVYGPGWRRDAAKVTHVGNGAFCYSFVPQPPPPGYPAVGVRGPGNGERHRVTVMGPGVTPIVQWEGAGLQGYDAEADRAFNALFDGLVGSGDTACRTER
jgi:hypothetical protein